MLTREAAREQRRPRFYTGILCVRGHDAERFTSSGACVVCARVNQNKWDARNREKLKTYCAKYDAANRERRRARAREYRQNHPQQAATATKKWRDNNLHILAAHTSKRRARILRAMPPWVNASDFVEIYNERARLSKQTGVDYQVDHIVPLKHELVCGLHVPWNLQIIEAAANRRKHNKFSINE